MSYPLEEWWRIASREARHSRLMTFNNSLENACKQHHGTVYMSLNDLVLNPDNSVKQEFKDINPVNLHLLWEPLIVLWADKLELLEIGLARSALVDMQRSASAYNSRKIQEVGDQVFSVGPRLRLIMDYLDGQAVESNEKPITPLPVDISAADLTRGNEVAPTVNIIKTSHPTKIVESDKERIVGAWRRSGDTSEGSRGHTRSNSGSGSGSGSRSRSDSYGLEYRSNGGSRIASNDSTVPGSPNEYGRRTSSDSRQRDDRFGSTTRKTYADSYNLNAVSSGSNGGDGSGSGGGSGGRYQGGSSAHPQTSHREGSRSEGATSASAGRLDGVPSAHLAADNSSDSLSDVPYLKGQSQQYQYQYRAPPPLVTDGDANDDSNRGNSAESRTGYGLSRQGRHGEGETDKYRLHRKQSRGQNEERPKETRQPPPPPQLLRDPDRDRDRDRDRKILTSPRQQTLSDRFQSLSSPRQHIEDDYEDERNPPQRLRQPFEGRHPQGDRNNPQRREKERYNRR